jgi:uncharacterized protein YbjT (DUF2867 family)
MKVMIFGATGMVGAGVLRECLLAPDVDAVLVVGRQSTGQQHAKLREIVRTDLFDLHGCEAQLSGYDACFYCLGVTSMGMSEQDYRRISFDMTLAVAQMLLPLNPAMTFVYVTGAGADSAGSGSVMWARVKGATENALLQMPFRGAFMFRPAVIQPLHGIRSKTRWYQLFYDVAGPLLNLLRRWLPRYVTSTEEVGQAMLAVARRNGGRGVLENIDIHRVAQGTRQQ